MSVHNNGKNATEGLIKQDLCWLWAAGKRKVSVLVISFFVLCLIAIIFETFSLVLFLSLASCWPFTQALLPCFLWQIPLPVTEIGSHIEWGCCVSSGRLMTFVLWHRICPCLFKFPLSKLVYTFSLKVLFSVYFLHCHPGLPFTVSATA